MASIKKQQAVIARAKTYDQYVCLVNYINATRKRYNAEMLAWVCRYNDEPTLQTIALIGSMISPLHPLQAILQEKRIAIGYRQQAEDWLAEQLKTQILLMKTGWWFKPRARLARKKYRLLTKPSASVYQYLRYKAPDFHQQYLNYCNQPPLYIGRVRLLPALSLLSPESFIRLQQP